MKNPTNKKSTTPINWRLKRMIRDSWASDLRASRRAGLAASQKITKERHAYVLDRLVVLRLNIEIQKCDIELKKLKMLEWIEEQKRLADEIAATGAKP